MQEGGRGHYFFHIPPLLFLHTQAEASSLNLLIMGRHYPFREILGQLLRLREGLRIRRSWTTEFKLGERRSGAERERGGYDGGVG